MNILITGASGFIGSRLAALSGELFEKDDNVILLTSKEIEGFKCILHKGYTYTQDDFLMQGIDKIDVVIHVGHFLAESHPGEIESLGNISSINNTVHLLQNLPAIPQKFIYCSTMAVYGTNRGMPVDEHSDLKPENIYACSKIVIEMFLKEWAKNNDVNLHILRLAHIYGPQDKRRYSIPVWLQAQKNDQPIKLLANPEQKRNCLYIDDCCRFIARACYLQEKIGVINLASSQNATMAQIAELCSKVSGNRRGIILESGTNQDVGLAFKDGKLREKYLGMEKYTLEEGLREEFYYYNMQRGE